MPAKKKETLVDAIIDLLVALWNIGFGLVFLAGFVSLSLHVWDGVLETLFPRLVSEGWVNGHLAPTWETTVILLSGGLLGTWAGKDKK